VEVSRVNIRTINRNRIPESSSTIRKRVIKAKKIQEERFKGLPLTTNSQMGIKEVEIFCKLPEPLRHMLGEVTEKMGLSLRAYHKILKVARTIADLEAEKEVNRNHLLEAVSYRFLDRTSPF
jgi:magnesium chelatase family protein